MLSDLPDDDPEILSASSNSSIPGITRTRPIRRGRSQLMLPC